MQARADTIEAARLGGLVDPDIAHRFADCANAAEPGVSRKVVRTWQRHRRGRCQARSNGDLRTRGDSGREFILIDRDADPRRKFRIPRRDHQPDRVTSGEMIDAFDATGHFGDHRAFDLRKLDPRCASPDEPAPQGRGKGEPTDRAPCPPTSQAKAYE